MRIQCDACEAAAATVVCCADEAALCARCDVEIHAANKLAGKHQRLPLALPPGSTGDSGLPRCDVCQERPAFVFCVEDRALLCRDCDEPIHVPGTLSGGHRRYLATGIRVGFSSICGAGAGAEGIPPPPKQGSSGSKPAAAVGAPAAGNAKTTTTTTVEDALPQEVPSSPFLPPSGWAVEDLLQLSDYESSDKLQKDSPLGFNFKELEWFADIDLFHAHSPAKTTTAEVPELLASPQPASNGAGFYKTNGAARQSKKPRLAVPEDEEDYFIVPDLG